MKHKVMRKYMWNFRNQLFYRGFIFKTFAFKQIDTGPNIKPTYEELQNFQSCLSNAVVDNEDDEYLTSVLVDIGSRYFVMFSSDRNERKIECDSIDEFMNVLELIKKIVDDEIVYYTEPCVTNTSGKFNF